MREFLLALPATVLLVVTLGLPLVYQPPMVGVTVFVAATSAWFQTPPTLRTWRYTAEYFMFYAAVSLTVMSFVGWFLYST